MRPHEARRYRGLVGDFVGGLLTFALEFAVVAGLAVIALIVAIVVIVLA